MLTDIFASTCRPPSASSLHHITYTDSIQTYSTTTGRKASQPSLHYDHLCSRRLEYHQPCSQATPRATTFRRRPSQPAYLDGGPGEGASGVFGAVDQVAYSCWNGHRLQGRDSDRDARRCRCQTNVCVRRAQLNRRASGSGHGRLAESARPAGQRQDCSAQGGESDGVYERPSQIYGGNIMLILSVSIIIFDICNAPGKGRVDLCRRQGAAAGSVGAGWTCYSG